MNETESTQRALFKSDVNLNDSMNLVIEDKEEKQKYLLDEIRNRIILGDTFKVLKKLDDECIDMIFIDPPYFLQLPENRPLIR